MDGPHGSEAHPPDTHEPDGGGAAEATAGSTMTDSPANPEPQKSILESLLPRTAPRVEGFDLAGGTALEASQPGTTIWISLQLAGGRTALAAALFQGTETPPVLTLAVTRAFAMELGRMAESPASVLAGINDALARTKLAGGSQLVACAIVVPGPSGAAWACAGTIHAGVIRRAGTFDELASHGPPLGMLPGFKYGVTEVDLGPGDEILVLAGASDGLFRGATDLVASLAGKPAGEVISTVQKAIRKARADESQIETSVLFLRKH